MLLVHRKSYSIAPTFVSAAALPFLPDHGKRMSTLKVAPKLSP